MTKTLFFSVPIYAAPNLEPKEFEKTYFPVPKLSAK